LKVICRGLPDKLFVYADGFKLTAHSLDDAEQLLDRFHAAAVRFGLTVNLKKTKVMFQPAGHSTAAQPVIKAGDTTINAVNRFYYLSSIHSSDALVDDNISTRLSKASSAFGRLSERRWNDHGIQLDTKVAVYTR